MPMAHNRIQQVVLVLQLIAEVVGSLASFVVQLIRELEDPPSVFGEQQSSIRKFGNTLYKTVAEKEKGEVMEAADGNMELFNIKEPATLAKSRDQLGGVFKSPIQASDLGNVLGAVKGNLESFIKVELASLAKPRDQKGGVFVSPFQPLVMGESRDQLGGVFESPIQPSDLGDVLGAVKGNLESFIKMESASLAKPGDQKGGVFVSPFQPLVTGESPLPISRTVRPPFVDLTNTLDLPMCTSLPSKPSWTRINRLSSEPEETLKDPVESSLQVSMDERGFWKKLWKIPAPGKIKHFLWRACTNSLATKENLVKRKILTDATCSRCLVASEGSLHSLWSCSSLKEVWEKDFGWIFSSGATFTSFKELVELVFTKPESVALFATTAWSKSDRQFEIVIDH
ncbi:hypothetical protein CFP56_032411 [Quercus suber]|uniref:Reverse transcriptase zinc-binding domain-containing protein n=1 Tax=Quercus suber TaxID=58331 RepID=A0AAW0JHN3_QUESU